MAAVSSSSAMSPVVLTTISDDLTTGWTPTGFALLFSVQFAKGICPSFANIIFVSSATLGLSIRPDVSNSNLCPASSESEFVPSNIIESLPSPCSNNTESILREPNAFSNTILLPSWSMIYSMV